MSKMKELPADAPEVWLSFLGDLLEPEDIPTLQAYLGYCLIPSTKAQKMLMIIGKGCEGKSRIGLVMRSLLGNSMNATSIQKIETNRFSRADLEDKLLMVDDDMDMNALPKTNYIKSIVTSEAQMDVERKGVQSYQCQLYARFLCFGNGALAALHDRSDGFFRRQVVMTAKDRPADRADDPFLVEKMITQMKKYSAAFRELKAENQVLTSENETLTDELKERRQESVLKKMAESHKVYRKTASRTVPAAPGGGIQT